MSKKIPVLNSPWGREYERPSDCQRWIQNGHALLKDGALEFTQKFVDSIVRQSLEYDPTGFDDGTSRRWTRTESGSNEVAEAALNGNLIDGHLIVSSPGGLPVLQLRPVKDVGTAKGVQRKRDNLIRPQHRNDKGRTMTLNLRMIPLTLSESATLDTHA